MSKLNIVINQVSPKKISYSLYYGGEEKYWRIPAESKFDTSVLITGGHYLVTTTKIASTKWDVTKRKRVAAESYEWQEAVLQKDSYHLLDGKTSDSVTSPTRDSQTKPVEARRLSFDAEQTTQLMELIESCARSNVPSPEVDNLLVFLLDRIMNS